MKSLCFCSVAPSACCRTPDTCRTSSSDSGVCGSEPPSPSSTLLGIPAFTSLGRINGGVKSNALLAPPRRRRLKRPVIPLAPWTVTVQNGSKKR
eukprot:scaffold8081_cov444-Prasinococcus_capsulatus_cf.AAC.1